MNSNDWQHLSLLDDIESIAELSELDKDSKSKARVQKRKWREIEALKEQRRMKRELSHYEQYSY